MSAWGSHKHGDGQSHPGANHQTSRADRNNPLVNPAAVRKACFLRQSREDEWFYILEGEITLEIDGKRTTLHTGGSAFAPRGSAHTFQNFTNGPAEILVLVTPGGFNQFFEELSSWNRGLPVPDLVRREQLMNEYGIELLGPPLS